MIRKSYSEIFNLLKDKLLQYKFEEEDADLLAEIFTENTLVGVSSHGVNRFTSFIELVESGHIQPKSKPTLEKSFNSIEQWNGNYGPGPLNAWFITDAVINLSKKFGIGCVGLKNTNHWMRAGAYGWKAAEMGYILICWTNTIPILPPWGAKESTIGNNPIVFSMPRKEGPVVLDMAISQFSYGKLATYRREGKMLPWDGGYDSAGQLTKDPGEIYKTHRPLPIGLWKGSGLSLLFDLIATVLSGGRSTFDLSKTNIDSGMSQVFIAIDPSNLSSANQINESVNQIIDYYKSAEADGGEEIVYPGERALKTKNENLKIGIPVDETIWNKIINL